MLSFLKEEGKETSADNLSAVKTNELLSRIHKLMGERKPFLQPHYTLEDLARDLEIPAYQLSAFVNTIMQQRYNDLINNYRIAYCLEQLKNNESFMTRVHHLAAACGFGNRNTFISAFKKVTHQTPHAYLSQLKKQREH